MYRFGEGALLMPLLNSAVPRYRKHRASGQAVVSLSGQDFYLGPYGTKVSRDAYDRAIAEWLARGRHPPLGRPRLRPDVGTCLRGKRAPLRRARSTRIRRIASAAAAKKWPREEKAGPEAGDRRSEVRGSVAAEVSPTSDL
jgi:hypothetical protein